MINHVSSGKVRNKLHPSFLSYCQPCLDLTEFWSASNQPESPFRILPTPAGQFNVILLMAEDKYEKDPKSDVRSAEHASIGSGYRMYGVCNVWTHYWM